MIIVPYGTDAPIYHPPIVTVGLIIVNILAFVACAMTPDEEAVRMFMLNFGEWNPIQWLTSNFMHAGIVHLLGNMIFLWAFGLVVEGKLGWWKFLVVYLGIGIVSGMVQQTVMLWAHEGQSLGASTAIFGLLVIAAIWAPRNEMNCVFIWWWRFIPRVHQFDVSILMFSAIALVLQIFIQLIVGAIHSTHGLHMSTEALHLLGGILGLVVGIGMVKLKLVDCEGWDIFSTAAGKHLEPSDADKEAFELVHGKQKPASSKKPGPAKNPASAKKPASIRSTAKSLQEIRNIIAEGNPALAYAAHQRMLRENDSWKLPDDDLLMLISAFHERQQWSESVAAMVEYLRIGGERNTQVRLKLAQILLQYEKRPQQALNVLKKLQISSLTDKQRAVFDRLHTKAVEMCEEDPYELAGEDW